MLPWLAEEDRDAALGYVWQAAAALHVAYDVDRPSTGARRRRPRPPTTLVERRLASGDEHAIKLTEAALRSFGRSGDPALLLGGGRRLPPASERRRGRRCPRRRALGSFGAMEYRTLGSTGIKVSPLCLGAMMFGSFGNPDHDDSIRIIHAALDAGINFVDTADVYSFGESEEIVGKALAQTKRHKVVLATKVHGQMGQDPNAQGNSRRWIMAECDNSLRRLGIDYIDLYQIHRPSPETDIDETLGALTDLVRAGKIRYFGSSTFPAHEIVEAQWVAERRARERFVTEQPPYSILVRGIEKDVLPMCQKYGMGVLSWSPLAGGWLSGAFGPGKENTSRRADVPAAPLRHGGAGQPGQARGGRPAHRAGRQRRADAHSARARLRAGAPGRDVAHHRARAPWSTSSPSCRRSSSAWAADVLDRIDEIVAAGHRPQRHRRRLGAGRHRGSLAAPPPPAGGRPAAGPARRRRVLGLRLRWRGCCPSRAA